MAGGSGRGPLPIKPAATGSKGSTGEVSSGHRSEDTLSAEPPVSDGADVEPAQAPNGGTTVAVVVGLVKGVYHVQVSSLKWVYAFVAAASSHAARSIAAFRLPAVCQRPPFKPHWVVVVRYPPTWAVHASPAPPAVAAEEQGAVLWQRADAHPV